jgi:cation:H+ antiporter
VGLIVLGVGGEFLVRGSSRLARALGVPAFIVGLTVVSLGTSAPELVVCVISAWKGKAAFVLGNVVGSNIINVLVVLGVSAAIAPVPIDRRLFKNDLMIMLAVTCLLIWLSRDDALGRVEAGGMLLSLGAYLWWQVRSARSLRANGNGGSTEPAGAARVAGYLLMIAVGLGGLSVGAHWMVQSAEYMARAWGISETVVGLAILAGGTSLPELATFVTAAIHRQHALAVGNIVGSNVFNILGILGCAGLIHPVTVERSMFIIHYPVMILAALVLGLVVNTGHRVTRSEGCVAVALYAAYAWCLYSIASEV